MRVTRAIWLLSMLLPGRVSQQKQSQRTKNEANKWKKAKTKRADSRRCSKDGLRAGAATPGGTQLQAEDWESRQGTHTLAWRQQNIYVYKKKLQWTKRHKTQNKQEEKLMAALYSPWVTDNSLQFPRRNSHLPLISRSYKGPKGAIKYSWTIQDFLKLTLFKND